MSEEPRKAGRPRKHLADEHHYKPASETVTITENLVETADAPNSQDSQASAVLIPEAVVENFIVETADHSLPESISEENPSDTHVENVSTQVLELPIIQQESPIEQKIHQLVDEQNLNGWHPIETEIVLQCPPRNGMPVRLTETPHTEGILAIWKKTRKFANATHRWAESGKWIDFHTGLDISFEPKYWKERY